MCCSYTGEDPSAPIITAPLNTAHTASHSDATLRQPVHAGVCLHVVHAGCMRTAGGQAALLMLPQGYTARGGASR